MKTRLLLSLATSLMLSGCLSVKDKEEVVQCKPSELQMSGSRIFAHPETTHEALSGCHMFLYIGSDPAGNSFSFLPDQRFKGNQIRSAFPPAYSFSGRWRLTGDGYLQLKGKFHNFSKKDEGLLPAEQTFSLIVSEVEFIPEWKRLKLFIQKEKESNK